MGGKGAKERRRLQRLAAAASEGGSPEKNRQNESGKEESDNTCKISSKQHQKKEHVSSQHSKPATTSAQAGRSQRRNQQQDSYRQLPPRGKRPHQDDKRPPSIEPKKKKTKFKKPKHLKRKIERLSEDDEERQKLVSELHEWEDRKKTLSVHKGVKRQKDSGDRPRPVVVKQAMEAKGTMKQDEMIKRVMANAPRDVERREHPAASAVPAIAPVPDTKTPTSPEESESDSESDVSLEEPTKRQRGRRRRGRKAADAQRQEETTEINTAEETKQTKLDETTKDAEETPAEKEAETTIQDTKKKTNKQDTRWCIGRKPVTDFSIGQRYEGTVIYTKPFGAFIDIGCHSDAFCHVSRIRNDFVESINDALHIGDRVSARVVEVDRKAKRVTVSLQTDARIEDERASIEARKHRVEKREAKRANSTSNVVESAAPRPRPKPENEESNATTAAPLDESTMTPAQLKRARKLARRAARREQQAQMGIAA